MRIKIQGVIVKRVLEKKTNLGLLSIDAGAEFRGEFSFPNPTMIVLRKFEDISIELLFEDKRMFYSLNQDSFLIIPADYEIVISSSGDSCAFTIFFPNNTLYPRLRTNCALAKTSFDKIFFSPELLVKKNWINELFLRYVFEIVETKNRTNYVVRFLELEIMKELYFTYQEQRKNVNEHQFAPSTHSLKKTTPLLQKALVFIESNLIKELSVKSLAKKIGASESTLLRTFKKELKKTPDEYIRIRKLNEAKFIIRSKQHNISETAYLLGYSSVAAFSNAFKKHFKISPIAILTNEESHEVD